MPETTLPSFVERLTRYGASESRALEVNANLRRSVLALGARRILGSAGIIGVSDQTMMDLIKRLQDKISSNLTVSFLS
jgi:hypothetical protein